MNFNNLNVLENLESNIRELIINIIEELIENNCLYFDEKEQEIVFSKELASIYV